MLDEATTAFLFPGQGSQFVGMGRALAEAHRVARQTFEEADEQLDFPLSKLCFEGPEDVLTDTVNAQPALYVAGVAAMRTLYEALGDSFQPAFVAGHSLGELTALTAAGALSFPHGLKLVRRRGELMKQAGQQHPGGMGGRDPRAGARPGGGGLRRRPPPHRGRVRRGERQLAGAGRHRRG